MPYGSVQAYLYNSFLYRGVVLSAQFEREQQPGVLQNEFVRKGRLGFSNRDQAQYRQSLYGEEGSRLCEFHGMSCAERPVVFVVGIHNRCIDLGDIRNARAAESYMPLWMALWKTLGTMHFNIKVVR